MVDTAFVVIQMPSKKNFSQIQLKCHFGIMSSVFYQKIWFEACPVPTQVAMEGRFLYPTKLTIATHEASGILPEAFQRLPDDAAKNKQALDFVANAW